MKPSETGYITFNIQNPGNNPVNVWKTIKNITTSDEPINEPECVYGGGVWDSSAKACDKAGYTAKSNLQDWMYYDLSVFVPIPENSDGGWWQTIYKDSDKVTVGSISGNRIFLGMVPAGKTMKVTQSYHLQPETENWAQADTMTFDIEIYAEQLTGKLVLENKTGVPDWQIKGGDGIQGTLTYNLTSPTFDYKFEATGLTGSTDYSLIYYADPWPGDGVSHDTGVLIAKFTAAGGIISSTSGSINLGMDLPQWPSDQNHPEGAKIWLVPSSDYSTVTPGVKGHMTAWNPANYLFETALITYEDTNN
jgi:hypothetical protein